MEKLKLILLDRINDYENKITNSKSIVHTATLISAKDELKNVIYLINKLMEKEKVESDEIRKLLDNINDDTFHELCSIVHNNINYYDRIIVRDNYCEPTEEDKRLANEKLPYLYTINYMIEICKCLKEEE